MALAVLLAGSLKADEIPAFTRVNASILRGGQPSREGLASLKEMGVKRVIDLRQEGHGREDEEAEVRSLGMIYVHQPWAEFHAPSDSQMRAVLALLEDDCAGTTFIHCRRGKDRTGTAIACYRMEHDRWTVSDALEEAKRDGLSRFERGMLAFIGQFRPLPSQLLLVGPPCQ